MKNIISYITESIRPLSRWHKGIIVCDIDDTLLRANYGTLYIYKQMPDGTEQALSTDEYAKDPDAVNNKSLFDYRDFLDPDKIYNSIINGMPLIRNLKIVDAYINAGYDFCFLTARGCEYAVIIAIEDFLKIKDKHTGALKTLGKKFKKELSAAVNDTEKHYAGNTDAEKKANVLRKLCNTYNSVVFVDDDDKNLAGARRLNLPNLKVIKAWED